MSGIKFEFPEGTPQNVIAALSDESVVSFVEAFVEAQKKPILENRDSLLNEKSQLSKQLKDLGGFDGITAMKTELETLRTQVTDKSGKEKSLEEMLAEKDAKIKAFEGERVKTIVERKMREAFNGADLEMLQPFIERRMKYSTDKDGNVVIEVNKEDGLPMLKNDGKTADLKDLATEFKSHQKYGMFFPADNLSGSGARGSSQGSASKFADNPWVPGPHFNSTKQMTLIRTDPDTARAMAAAAGKTLPDDLRF